MAETPITIPQRDRVVASPSPRQLARTFSLLLGAQPIPLELGVVTVGRSSRCDVVLEDPEVSRHHARLTVSPTGVLLEDTSSSNGVYVNGARVRGVQALHEGDSIVLGGIELTIKASYRISSQMPAVARVPPPPRSETPEPTTRRGRRTDAFNELARLSDRMLSMGRPEVAVKLMSERLQSLLQALRMGEDVSPRMLQSATVQALRLALAQGITKYVDLSLELDLLAKAVMGDEACELLEQALEQLSGVDGSLLLFYQQMLHGQRQSVGPFDRIRTARILGFRCKD